MFDYERFRNDVLALGLLALVVFVGLSFLSYDPADPPSDLVFPARRTPINICGSTGAAIAFYGRQVLGAGVWMVMAAMVAWDINLFSRDITKRNWLALAGTALLVLSSCVAFQLALPSINSGSTYGSGGVLGAWMGVGMQHAFSPIGVFILTLCGLLSGWMLSPLWAVTSPGVKLATLPLAFLSSVGSVATAIKPKAREESSKEVATVDNENEVDEEKYATLSINMPAEPVIEEPVDDEPEEEELEEEDEPELKVNAPAELIVHRPEEGEYVARQYDLPDLRLLEEPEEFPYEFLAKKARIAAATLEKTFEQFGLNIRVSEVDTGPAVTQFELDLEPGLRLNKVTALEDDLAIGLRVPAVRVVAPIPGKNTVGVEVPNEKQVTVRLRELIQTYGSKADEFKIPLFFGKDVSGRPLAVDLAKMPHLLIAGRTGTGKSVCLNTLILSMLMTRTPDEVKMLMIDPKMVELSPYKNLPHLMHPVITDMKKAEAVLAWAVDKMEERYDLLSKVGVRHLEGFNKMDRSTVLSKMGISELHEEAQGVPHKMPYIVIIADEMADLMMTSGKDVEAHIIRLAQKSRAVGIHLVLATQKPTVDVITGLIKSNLPARVSFQVASKMDSRVVLDEGGAERLLGCGDMLYLAPGTSSLTRAQGTYVSDEEINAVIDFFSDVEPEYSEELQQVVARSAQASTEGSGDSGPRPNDSLYDDACDVVVREGRGSCSLLQRCLGIGYGRASRMIDWMAEDGIVGEHNGANAREVLFTVDEWESEKASRTG
ncbi:DNA translocase FtsK [Fuerstiella marisgermanici]|uniref:Stage III sporulation protein E n=1 Tax=Fuerstiella marisgermanici TaxID=1891926 RepID=A0A1P8WJ54_9PLAN|nr:DNA translocase FtsK [Fuerstiella marisgermanici]APZ94095.1 Stage III sporulation protein E [Fuerstiella marisgermanici]